MQRKGKNTGVVTAQKVASALSKTATTAREEQLLRMRYGAGVEFDTPLPQVYGGDAALEDELLLVEMALLRAVKRRAAAVRGRARTAEKKHKIVTALMKKKKT